MTVIISWIKVFIMAFLAGLFMLLGVPLALFGKAGAYYKKTASYFGRAILKSVGGKPTFSGLENVDPTKSYVLVGNHQSYMDIFLVQTALLEVGMRPLFMVKEELYSIPFFKFMTRHMGLIPVAREQSKKAMQSVINAIKTAKDGYSIVIYAEGTRSDGERVQPFKRGAFMLAEKSCKPILPFAITGTSYIFPKDKMRFKSGACHVSFMPAVEADSLPSKELMQTVENMVRDKFYEDKAEIDKLWRK